MRGAFTVVVSLACGCGNLTGVTSPPDDGGVTTDAATTDAMAEAGDDGPIADAGLEVDSTPVLGCGSDLNCDRYVFVTSTEYTGDLGGHAGADQLCMERAAAGTAVLHGRTFHAWLSTVSEPASAWFQHGLGAYKRADGMQVASSYAALTSGTLDTPIDHDETGGVADGAMPGVWTGTSSSGAYAMPDCADWQIADVPSQGTSGSFTQTTGAWTDATGITSCSGVAHLYCIEY